jgi:hypothetical protein
VRRLLDQTSRYGPLPDGSAPLEAILRYLREVAGPDKQQAIDSILARLPELQQRTLAEAAEPPPPTPAFPETILGEEIIPGEPPAVHFGVEGVAPTAALVPFRLDTALPEKVVLGQTFDVAVAVRQPDSPKLKETDLTQRRSAAVNLDWPEDEPFIRLQLQLRAPDCRIEGDDQVAFRLYKGQDSPVFYFHLTPEQAGELTIVVILLQETEWLGSSRVRTSVVEGQRGQIQMKVTSQDVVSSQQEEVSPAMAVHLRDWLAAHFSEDELRELCFEMGIDYADLPGETKRVRIISLIGYVQRRGQYNHLVKLGWQLRPNARQRPELARG